MMGAGFERVGSPTRVLGNSEERVLTTWRRARDETIMSIGVARFSTAEAHHAGVVEAERGFGGKCPGFKVAGFSGLRIGEAGGIASSRVGPAHTIVAIWPRGMVYVSLQYSGDYEGQVPTWRVPSGGPERALLEAVVRMAVGEAIEVPGLAHETLDVVAQSATAYRLDRNVATLTATFVRGGRSVRIGVGSKHVEIDGVERELTGYVVLREGRWYVPTSLRQFLD